MLRNRFGALNHFTPESVWLGSTENVVAYEIRWLYKGGEDRSWWEVIGCESHNFHCVGASLVLSSEINRQCSFAEFQGTAKHGTPQWGSSFRVKTALFMCAFLVKRQGFSGMPVLEWHALAELVIQIQINGEKERKQWLNSGEFTTVWMIHLAYICKERKCCLSETNSSYDNRYITMWCHRLVKVHSKISIVMLTLMPLESKYNLFQET